MGFMIGHDATWLPEALRLVRDELPDIHVVISTQNSPQLAAAVSLGTLDVAFLRRGDATADLTCRPLLEEPLEVFLPHDHPLAAQETIGIRQFLGETFLSVSGAALGGTDKPPALRRLIDAYLEESGIHIKTSHEVDNLGGVMSLIASTGGLALLPSYAKTFLPAAVTTRPLQGRTPTIDLSLGYIESNPSPTLRRILAKTDALVARVKIAV